MMTRTIGPNIVKLTSDKYARMNGLNWEARFFHPVIGLVVMPYKTRAEAEAATLLVVGAHA